MCGKKRKVVPGSPDPSPSGKKEKKKKDHGSWPKGRSRAWPTPPREKEWALKRISGVWAFYALVRPEKGEEKRSSRKRQAMSLPGLQEMEKGKGRGLAPILPNAAPVLRPIGGKKKKRLLTEGQGGVVPQLVIFSREEGKKAPLPRRGILGCAWKSRSCGSRWRGKKKKKQGGPLRDPQGKAKIPSQKTRIPYKAHEGA